MEKDYKIEAKNTIWEVYLSKGEYSDHRYEYLYFSANDELEVWYFLCNYMKENPFGDYGLNGIRWENKKFAYGKPQYEGDKLDWCYDSGDIWKVNIARLKVIYFRK